MIDKNNCNNKMFNVIKRAQEVLAKYLDPGYTLTKDEAIDRLLAILDNEELVRMIESIKEI